MDKPRPYNHSREKEKLIHNIIIRKDKKGNIVNNP